MPQGRPRVTTRGKFPVVYDPPKSANYKKMVALQIMAHPHEKIEFGPVSVFVDFHMPRPKSLKKGTIHHIKKPDVDNLLKALLDALNGILWKDDSQICNVVAHKRYAEGDPFTYIQIAKGHTIIANPKSMEVA